MDTNECWQELGLLSQTFESLVNANLTSSNYIPGQILQVDKAPNLHLHGFIIDIKPKFALPTGTPSALISILEDSLASTATQMQHAFEAAWSSLLGSGECLKMAQSALKKLFVERFAHEASVRCSRVLTLLEEHELQSSLAERTENPENQETSEWTDATRSLMERVYQRHPKLEAHEKKLLAEVSGLSLRQISIWFANQRQRKGWLQNVQEEESPSPVVKAASPPKPSLPHRSPSPLTPYSAASTAACPSLSSSVSSRSSSDSWTASPINPHFNIDALLLPLSDDAVPHVLLQEQEQAQTPASLTPNLDFDQLLRQLSQQNSPAIAGIDAAFSSDDSSFYNSPLEVINGPFAMKLERQDSNMSGSSTSSSEHSTPLSQLGLDTANWLPINIHHTSPSLSQQGGETTLFPQSITDITPQASQFSFAPLQLDTSHYMQSSEIPSANIDLSKMVNTFDNDSFWNDFMINNNLPTMNFGAVDGQASSAQNTQQGTTEADTKSGIVMEEPQISSADWTGTFLKDMEAWSKPPEQAQIHVHF